MLFENQVALKFEKRFWEDPVVMGGNSFQGGRLSTDKPIRTVVFPSYGIKEQNLSGVMIASYTWGQDASRIGSMSKTEAVDLCLEDLRKLFGDAMPSKQAGPISSSKIPLVQSVINSFPFGRNSFQN